MRKFPESSQQKDENSQPNNQNKIPDGPWPGAFGAYKYSKAVVSFNLQTFLPLIIFAYAVDIAAAYTKSSIIKILLYLIFYLISLSIFIVLVSSLRGKKLSISEALDRGARISIQMIGLYILVGLAIIGSFILLIIPGLIVLPRLIFAPYYLIDKQLSITDAIKTSWRESEGHGLNTWSVIAVQILFGILSLIIVGIYFSIVYSAALIVLYGYINAHPKAAKKAAQAEKNDFALNT